MARPLASEAPATGPASSDRKVKLSVTLDSGSVHDLRRRVGSRGLSAVLNEALRNELTRLRQEEALDQWLEELEAEDGPIPSKLLDKWEKIWDDIDGAA